MAVYGGLAAFAWCVICLPVVLRAAAHWGFFDPPGPLKLHTRRIPRVGGIAVVSAFAVGMLVSGSDHSLRYLLGTLFVLWLAGIIDDLRGVSPILRLMAQAIVASVLCFGADLTVPFLDKKPLGWIVAGLLVMSLINAFNLLDGADGVAAGVAAVIGVGFLVDGAQSGASGASAAALIGSCLAFLAFNFPPAKIFLGDSGSTSLGLIVAFTGLEVHKANPSTKAGIFLLPIFAGLPLLDLALAILRRLRSGGSPFSGDRRHFYDLLLQKGWSSCKVALSTYAVTAGFVLVGLDCNRHSLADAICLVLLVTIPFLFIAVRLGALRPAL
jgi:UDP-GlcNAc:undecaprenyl-phosphate GlcNAc-1-phosphate transferase